ncbi:vWA domain-containing protein [Embleya sp. NPDC005971]|uniref:vWA domain-containing protein n=1 Tax=Embleya sp. NPDC005971 TaxID=3156724 RepID=UPI0034114A88
MLALLLVLLCAPATPAARRADDPRTADPVVATGRLLDELGADSQPADFYVVLDVSTSMLDDGNYDAAKAALKDFLLAMPAHDRISVIRFGAKTTTHLPLTTAPQGAAAIADFLAKLPKPNDTESDFGAAMVSVSEIIAADKRRTAGYLPPTAIVVLTDAQLYAPGNPDFANAKSPGWTTLRQEYAKAVEERGPIAAYALPLGENARGVDLIAEVLPKAQTLSGTVSQQAARLRDLEHDARKRKGVALIRVDQGATVRAEFGPGPVPVRGVRPDAAACAGAAPAPVQRVDLSRPTTLCLTLTSSALHIRVTVSGLQIDDPALNSGLPTSITLEPGIPAHVPVTLRAHDRTRSDAFATSTGYEAEATLLGTVSATQAAEFADLLQADGPYVVSRLRGGGLAYTGAVRGSVDWSIWVWLAVGLALTAAAATTFWRLFPKDVSIELTLDYKESYRFPEAATRRLRGMRHEWRHNHPLLQGATTSFVARGRRPRAGRGVTITARHEHEGRTSTSRRRLRIGESTMLYGVCVRVRSRPRPVEHTDPLLYETAGAGIRTGDDVPTEPTSVRRAESGPYGAEPEPSARAEDDSPTPEPQGCARAEDPQNGERERITTTIPGEQPKPDRQAIHRPPRPPG